LKIHCLETAIISPTPAKQHFAKRTLSVFTQRGKAEKTTYKREEYETFLAIENDGRKGMEDCP
jgi:hypothetical protein